MVLEVANALSTPSVARMTPSARMRPGVVHRNHQRGCAGSAGDRDAKGSVDGCANSTVTCATHLLVPSVVLKRILRASLRVFCYGLGRNAERMRDDTAWRHDYPHILATCVATETDG
jgi:hypothetical protein